MKTRNFRFSCFLILAFSLFGGSYGQAQEAKKLDVKKITGVVSPDAEAVPALLDEQHVAFHPLDVVNWAAYPYRPEVSFRMAHTGRELLLHYKVKEASVRALATADNGRVWEDACVEFFVSPEGDDCYYNFECNCAAKLLIQGGVWNERRPLAEPGVLAKVKRWSSLGTEPFAERTGECSWEVTLVIPACAFFCHSLTSLDGLTMKGNFYKCGDKLQTPHFLSWSPIRLERPMFHCPAFFGTLVFE